MLVVVRASGAGERRQVVQHFPGERRDLQFRDGGVRGVDFSRLRISHHHGQKALAVCHGGKAGTDAVSLQHAEAFIVAEEKDPVLDDRTADCGAELVLMKHRLQEVGGSLAEGVTGCVERGIAEKVIRSAVKCIGAGTHGDVDGGAAALAILCAVVVGDHFKFRDGVGRRLLYLIREALVAGSVGIVVDAFEQVVVVGAAKTIHDEGTFAAGRRWRLDNAGGEMSQARVGTAVERQFHHGCSVYRVTALAGIGFQQCCGAGNLNRFRHCANLERKFHSLAGVYIDHDVLGDGS